MTTPAVPESHHPNGVPRSADPQQQPLPFDVRYEQQLQLELHQGPLPLPEILARYEQVMPGLAGRIVGMAEREQEHRHQLERSEINEPFRLARRGQVAAIIAVAVVLAFAGYVASLGHEVTAGVIAALNIVGLVAVFITGQRKDASADPDRTSKDGQDGA